MGTHRTLAAGTSPTQTPVVPPPDHGHPGHTCEGVAESSWEKAGDPERWLAIGLVPGARKSRTEPGLPQEEQRSSRAWAGTAHVGPPAPRGWTGQRDAGTRLSYCLWAPRVWGAGQAL